MTRRADDRGSAIIEFVFVAVVLLIPLVYLLVAVSAIQTAETVAAQAAREAGRAFATADTQAQAVDRAALAERVALAHEVTVEPPELTFVAVGDPCTGSAITPRLEPGAQFAVCVRLRVSMPSVPRFVAGRGFTAIGRYVVHVDEYRST